MPKSLTVFIPDDLHIALKVAAAQSKQTVRDFVAAAIRNQIAKPAEGIKNGSEKDGSKEPPQKPQKRKQKAR